MKLEKWAIICLSFISCNVEIKEPTPQGKIIREAKELNSSRFAIESPCTIRTTYANIIRKDIVFPIFGGYGDSVQYSAITEKLTALGDPNVTCYYLWRAPAGEAKTLFHEMIKFYGEKLKLHRSVGGEIVPAVVSAEGNLWLLDYTFEQGGTYSYLRVLTTSIIDDFSPNLKDTSKLRFTDKPAKISVSLRVNAKPVNPWK